MRDEFTSRLTELVAKARTAISAAWDEMRAGPQQRAEMFPSFMVEGAWRGMCLGAVNRAWGRSMLG